VRDIHLVHAARTDGREYLVGTEGVAWSRSLYLGNVCVVVRSRATRNLVHLDEKSAFRRSGPVGVPIRVDSSRIVGSNSKIIAEPSFFHGGPRQIFHIPDKTTELVRVVR
jgi:hypothetical protein